MPFTHSLGIDLASRHTAAVLTDLNDGTVYGEWVVDLGKAEEPSVHTARLVRWLDSVWRQAQEVVPAYQIMLVVEDIPPHLINPKPVLRLQGALLFVCTLWLKVPELVLPRKWQLYFGCPTTRGTNSKKWAKELATEWGYVPGMSGFGDVPEKTYAKQREDLTDAYLISRYGARILWERETAE